MTNMLDVSIRLRVRACLVAALLAHGATAALAPAPASAQSAAEGARVDSVFAQWQTSASPGCAVAVAQRGGIVLNRAYGMADLEHGVANSPATIFEAGSVAKQFTAAAIVLLALDGVLGLDDDVRSHVPELPDYGHRITIRHLLNHTSGLRDWGSVAAIGGWGRGARTHTHDHVLEILARQRALNFVPGAEYSYSNSGYNLLAIIVDRVSGMSFAEFSRQRIFEPLGLTDTQWRDDYTRIVPGRAAAYSMARGSYVIDRPIEHVHGNGGLLTTVADLLTWNEALAAGRIGGAGFVQEMHRNGVLNGGETIEYASGISVGTYNGVPRVSHTGATAGYRAFLARFPQQQLGVAVLCNAGNVNPGVVGNQVADIFLGDASRPPAAASDALGPATRPEPAAMPAPAELAAYAGDYYSPDADATLRVVIEDGALVAHRAPATRLSLSPLSPDRFNSQLGELHFIRDDAGRVIQLSVRQARVYDLRFDRR